MRDGIRDLMGDVVHELLHIRHAYGAEQYGKCRDEIERKIDHETEEYLRKGITEIGGSETMVANQRYNTAPK